MGSNGTEIRQWIDNVMLGISILYLIIAVVSKIVGNKIDKERA